MDPPRGVQLNVKRNLHRRTDCYRNEWKEKCHDLFFFYLFNAFLQSTPSGAISKSGDGSGLGGEVVQ